jgi:hypothetical protein
MLRAGLPDFGPSLFFAAAFRHWQIKSSPKL